MWVILCPARSLGFVASTRLHHKKDEKTNSSFNDEFCTQASGMNQCSLSKVQGVWDDTAYSRHFGEVSVGGNMGVGDRPRKERSHERLRTCGSSTMCLVHVESTSTRRLSMAKRPVAQFPFANGAGKGTNAWVFESIGLNLNG